MEVASVFASVISREEWEKVPEQTGRKLEQFVTEKFEELFTCKALLETAKFNAANETKELADRVDALSKENDGLKSRLTAATNTVSELENQISQLTSDVSKFQTTAHRLEAEAAEYRHQRNLAIDERDSNLEMLQRRNTENERLQEDLRTATKQLENAVNSKCEALAQIHQVESMKLRIEYREKRLEQEKQLLNTQIESLSEDLNIKTDELLNMRRDNTSRCIQLENKLSEKSQELIVANEQIKAFTDLNNNSTTRIEELSQKLLTLRENDAKMNESYLHEIEAKTKLANAYKTMFDESQQHADELKEALAEVQQLLKHATEQYGELETKHKEAELTQDEILNKKNECITMLKKELEVSKELLDGSKNEQLQKDIEGLSPTAASASRLLKSGMTVTEIYAQYVAMSERLVDTEKENTQLKNNISSIVHEIQEKGPLITKLRENYAIVVDAHEELKNAHDELINEIQQLRDSHAESSRIEEAVSRENARYKKEVADLSRQVCHLLQEVENSRVGSSSTSTDMDLSDSVSSAEIITKKLVTFNDISELQKNNQKLLCLVRELTERQEEAESFDPAAIADLKMKVDHLRESQRDMLDERERQNKIMITIGNQRDMYKNLYSQAVKANGEEVSQLETSFNIKDATDPEKLPQENESQGDEKVQELTTQISDFKKKIEQLKTENDTYRKEKTVNEKILLEQLEKMRSEVRELVQSNCKLSSQLENNEEKFKISQNNIEIYKKQIAALEKQNKIYNGTIIKHEQTTTYLKDETMQSQTKLSKAEVMLGNLQKENALLKDAEKRWIKERENLKRDTHNQNMIQTNIELIKATLERTDAESKLRLEARLDEAHRECAALRRRLQEEQDRFRQLSEHLENQTQTAKERMNEEKVEADKLRKELAETRDELVLKANQMEELSKKLKSSILMIPESNTEAHRICELEQQVSDYRAEIEAFKSKLKTTKDASEQYFNVAGAAENQMKIVLEQKTELEETINNQKNIIKQLEEKCAELEGELSIQMDDQDIANASSRTKSHKLEEELNVTNMDLQTARDQLENTRSENKSLVESLKAVENKYAREVMLHSTDLQMLTDMKADLEKAMSEVNDIKQTRDCALQEVESNKISWQTQEEFFKNEKLELDRRFKEMEIQNSLLLDEIQALNNKLSIFQAQATQDPNQSVGETSFNRSFAEDEIKSSDQLLTIIKYLRQEKDIAVSKAEIIEAEFERLKSQYEVQTQQISEMKQLMETERQKSEVAVVTAAKHSEVLRKVETLNAITDSNRSLRQERDSLKIQVNELRERAETLAAEVAPTQEKNRALNIKAEAMQTENISLRGECTRWRQRAQMLIEKSNRTSPEDWKKLQGERETLAKQLTIERGNVAKLNDELNTLKQDKTKLDDQLKSVRTQNNNQSEEISKLKEDFTTLQTQLQQLTHQFEELQENNKRMTEENKVLTEDTSSKDININELKNNLTQIRKIAKKYKIQCEDQNKELQTLREEKENDHTQNEKQISDQRSEFEDRLVQVEQSNKESVERIEQQMTTLTEDNENYKKEIENLKQVALDREEKFKNLFKNAKDRILTLTEENSALKAKIEELEEIIKILKEGGTSSTSIDLQSRIDNLERDKANIISDKRTEAEKYALEIETLNQKVSQLQRKLGQQGSKPSTSSGSSEKPASEPPTANIKPMAGHSTNTQTQSVPIPPWRNAGETPLASIRPMSMSTSTQPRTVTVLPTSQSPSAVMVPPQQQVHTTGSSTIEALSSSSPTSSHTDYVPSTSSASSAMLGPRQVVVPPTQSSQDTEDDDNNMQVQPTPQQQAVALVLPRVEPPSSGPTQEQGTSSSSSSNTVTTTQAGHKRQRDDTDQSDDQAKTQQQSKRTRVQPAGTVSDSGLEVEYQVPTSSQRDHDDDTVILVESDDEGDADEGEGADDEPDDADAESYDMEALEQDNYEDADCQEVEDEEGGNEVEVIGDSSEVPNQSEHIQESDSQQEENAESAQPEATSSGADGGPGGVTFSQASTSASMTMSSFSRTRPIAPLPSRQQQSSHLLLPHGLEEGGDDGIVPSTPTLFVPRRSDGFGEAVSSPHVPSGRFTFNESVLSTHTAGSSEVVPEHSLEGNDENSTGRSVPSTPLQTSPQEALPAGEEQTSSQTTHSDAEIPSITISGTDEVEPAPEESSEECMGPPNVAGTSAEAAQDSGQVEDSEGFDGVSSEGEKQPTNEDDTEEEEGREAEASPSTNTRSRTTRGNATGTARRSSRSMNSRGMNRSGPTPIVWGEHRGGHHRHQDTRSGGRMNISPNYSPRVARRARGRAQRPYGRF